MSRCELRTITASGSESHAECQVFFSNRPQIERPSIVYRSLFVALIGVGSFIARLAMSGAELSVGSVSSLPIIYLASGMSTRRCNSVLRMALEHAKRGGPILQHDVFCVPHKECGWQRMNDQLS